MKSTSLHHWFLRESMQQQGGNWQFIWLIEKVALDSKKINLHWICLPLNLRNSVSVFQPHWRCWDPEQSKMWVRPMPQHAQVVSDVKYYPFFRFGMEFENFVYEWGKWFAGGELCTCLLGIRSDESLDRFLLKF